MIKSFTFCIENGKAISSHEVADQFKKAFDTWQALRTKDWVPPPRSNPKDREGWVYSPK